MVVRPLFHALFMLVGCEVRLCEVFVCVIRAPVCPVCPVCPVRCVPCVSRVRPGSPRFHAPVCPVCVRPVCHRVP